MASTYTNDLRLELIATGEAAATWGDKTNTNLTNIAAAFGYATQDGFAANADATTTVADGSADPARAMYFKVTSSATLTATRTLTIAPNTISRVMWIENATTGGQSIAISQGTGANVTIATGKTAVVYLDGAGSGAAVVDAMAGVSSGASDTLAEILASGNTTGGTDIAVSTGDDITFADSSKAIFGAGSDLQIYHSGTHSYIKDAGTGNLNILASTSINLLNGDSSDYMARFVEDGGATLYYDGSSKLATVSGGVSVTGELTATSLDISGDIDVDGTANLDIVDIDGAVDFASTTAHAGNATFADNAKAIFGASSDLQIYHDSNNSYIKDAGTGNLYINANELRIGNADNSKDYIHGNNGAEVKLFYNNALKLATTSTGIQVTGDIANASGDLTLDVAGRIILDADTDGNVRFSNSGILYGQIFQSTDMYIRSVVADKDLIFQGNDNGTNITALTLDMSLAGAATFNSSVTAVSGVFKNAADATGTTIKVQDNADRGITITSPIAASAAAGRIATSGTANSLEIGVRDYPTALTIAGGSGAATFSSTVTSTGLPLSVNTSLYNSNASLSYYAADNAVYLNGAGDAGWLRLQASGTSNGSNYIDIFGSGQGNYIVFKAGSTNSLNLNTGSAVFNESGADVDFRVESNNNANMLFVDGGNDRITIGGNDGTGSLHVKNKDNSGSDVHVVVQNTTANRIAGYKVQDESGNTGINLLYDNGGNTATLESPIGNFTLDAAGEIKLDTVGGIIRIQESGGDYGMLRITNSDFIVRSMIQDKDLLFQGNDGGSTITALTLDMSDAGTANFNHNVNLIDDSQIQLGSSFDMQIFHSGGANFIRTQIADQDLYIQGSDGGSLITALLFDMSAAGAATFNSSVTATDVNITSTAPVIRFTESDQSDKQYQLGSFGSAFAIYDANNTQYRYLIDTNGNHIFNEGGVDADFRVESDAFSSALAVEGSSGKVNVAAHFGIGKTSAGEQQSAGSGFFFVPGSSGYYSHISTIDTANFSSYFNRKTQTGGFFNFAVDNIGVGGVSYNGSATVYSTSSDERLKENIADADDAGSKIDAMQVRQFDWKSNGQHQEYGMVAQELLPIAPDSIAQGETEEDMMGVDYSTLVPMLIKEIQQLRQRVAKLES